MGIFVKMIKRIFKRNTHNVVFKFLAGAGRSFNRFYENRNHDIHSNGESYLLKQVAKLNPAMMFDVGANIGEYARLASKHCAAAKLYCFEPVHETFVKLKETTAGNPHIAAMPMGLFSERGCRQINLYPSNAHSSLYDIDKKASHVQSIDLNTGDYFMAEHGIDFVDLLKIDVEGAEMDVLLGFKEAFTNQCIRIVQFEYGHLNIISRQLLIDHYDFFDSCGYLVGKLYPHGVDFRSYELKHEDFIGPNYVAVRKTDKAALEILSLRG